MASVLVIFSGMLGFMAATLALLLGASFLGALALWVGTGLVALVIAGLIAALPRREPVRART